MFKKIKLHNFRTHVDTELELAGLTLLIGNNNTGKTNLFTGMTHFSRMLAKSRPASERPSWWDGELLPYQVRRHDFFQHRHRLCNNNDPMFLECEWENTEGKIEYHIELYSEDERTVGCREKISFNLNMNDQFRERKEIQVGYDKFVDRLLLRSECSNDASLLSEEKALLRLFFRNLAQIYSYHFQPAYLKRSEDEIYDNGAFDESRDITTKTLTILKDLGPEGGNLQKLLLQAKNNDERTFQRCIHFLRNFDNTFHGIRTGEYNSIIWEFNLGGKDRGRLDEFPPNVVSDGLLKAAAVALITALHHPPPLILLEEIENGINPANIREFLNWLLSSSISIIGDEKKNKTQFIITSHSPTVLREFADKPQNVYTVHLHKYGYRSDVRNLSIVLETLYGIGTVSVDSEPEEINGKKIIKLKPYELAELWYAGTIG